MKTSIRLSVLLLACYMLFSCTTSKTITVAGEPGTEIYSPNMQQLAVIGHNGNANIRISDNDYFAYLMARQAGAKELVPFALDYKHKKHIGTQFLRGAGYTLTLSGLAVMTTGLVCLISGDDDTGTTLAGCGGAITAIGAAMGVPATNRLEQTQYRHQFTYLPYHKTNQDIRFLPITDNGYRKTGYMENRQDENATQIVPQTENTEQTSMARSRASNSKRTLRNYGKLLSGNYIGKGVLSQQENVIEKYEDIKIIIQRIDNNNVFVEVIEGGESFFSSKSQYSIQSSGKGTYTLSLKGIPSAFIRIDALGNLTYYHPKVKIDGELYILEISAHQK